MKVKVKDIAKAAGVSTTAVSLVLNGKPSRLSDATKEKITRIAREMAFQRDTLGTVTSERAKTLGLILPNVHDPFYLDLFVQIQQYAYSLGYMVFTCMSDDDSERTSTAIESLATKNIDGILLIAPATVERDDRLTQMLKILTNGSIPFVLIDRAIYSVFCDFVTTDNKYGGRVAVLHLSEQGHLKIGCLTGPPNVYTSRKRLQGYREGLAISKQPYSDELVYYGDLSKESGKEGPRVLYERGCRAIFVASSLMTDGAIEFAAEQGLSIPDDLAIVGYDTPSPSVPCICQNVSLMAEKSVDLLIEQIDAINSKTPPRNFYITPTLSQSKDTTSM